MKSVDKFCRANVKTFLTCLLIICNEYSQLICQAMHQQDVCMLFQQGNFHVKQTRKLWKCMGYPRALSHELYYVLISNVICYNRM
jgi:hypothetical protein